MLPTTQVQNKNNRGALRSRFLMKVFKVSHANMVIIHCEQKTRQNGGDITLKSDRCKSHNYLVTTKRRPNRPLTQNIHVVTMYLRQRAVSHLGQSDNTYGERFQKYATYGPQKSVGRNARAKDRMCDYFFEYTFS